jgi:xylulokinase
VPLVVGIDCSTQTTKALVVDSDDGSIVASGASGHEVHGVAGARETDPTAWETSLEAALSQTGRGREVAALSVGGQQHGLVVLGPEGLPLRRAPLWNDTRGAADAQGLVAAMGGPERAAARVGSVLTSSFTVAHWAWLRRTEPDLAALVHRVLLPHDYLHYRLTAQATTDRSDVSGTGWWSPADESYAQDVLALSQVQLPETSLPTVLGPEGVAGVVTTAAAQRFGLPPGALVACGAGDNAGAALALDFAPGEAAMSLGTSGTVYAPASSPSADPTGTVAGFASADGRFLPLACTLNATLAIDRVSEWLGLDREDVAPSDGVVFLPWLGGERTPNVPNASGTLVGLRYDTDRRSVLQAAYEGLVGTLLEATAFLDHWAPQDPQAALLLLGGGARGRAWQETVRRLSGRPLLVVEAAELVAYGAAVQAAAVLTGSPVREVASRWQARRGQWLEPVRRDEAALERLASWRQAVLPTMSAPATIEP